MKTKMRKIKDSADEGFAEVRTFECEGRNDIYATIAFDFELRNEGGSVLVLTAAECDKLVRALGYEVTG